MDDVVFEEDSNSDPVTSFTKGGDTQVQKLKKKLKETELKAKENLDGWQRLKADMANGKKEESERLARAKARGTEEVLESLLPALDSFDSAMQGEAWATIDSAWRQGMEFVYNQLLGALETHGVTSFGAAGDVFDANLHEAAEYATVADAQQNERIQKVLRKGYKGAKVVRPARVVVGQYTE